MKKIKNICIFFLLSVIALFTAISCEQSKPQATGNITISINEAINRAIEPNISLEVSKYIVKGTAPNGVSFTTELTPDSATYTKSDALTGTWTIKAVAYNSSNKDIGEGITTISVTAGKTSTANVIVNEYEGNGNFTVNLSALYANYTAVISKVIDGVLTEIQNKNMVTENGIFIASFSLVNGYYTLSFRCDNESIKLPAPVAFRIVKDDDILASFTGDEFGSISITIDDKIATTPILSIALSKVFVTTGESITATASASKGNYGYLWFVDDAPLNDTSTNILSTSFSESGTHKISCLAADAETGISISSMAIVTVIE